MITRNMKNRKPIIHSMITRSMNRKINDHEEEIESEDEEEIGVFRELRQLTTSPADPHPDHTLLGSAEINYTQKPTTYYYTLFFLAIVSLLFIIDNPIFYMVFYVACNILFPLP